MPIPLGQGQRSLSGGVQPDPAVVQYTTKTRSREATQRKTLVTRNR